MGNFMPIFLHFIGGAFSGPRRSNDSKPSQEYWCELKQFLSLTCEARQASRKCMENAIDSSLVPRPSRAPARKRGSGI